MSSIYKIETYSDDCATKVADFIQLKGGRCVVQGWAVVTDYSFKSQQSQGLMSLISTINMNISENDFYHLHQIAAA